MEVLLRHEHWKSQIGAVMTMTAGAVGLGTLLEFPTSMQLYAGTSFFYFYVFFLFFLSIPVSVAESIFGKHSQKSAICSFKKFSNKKSFFYWAGTLPCVLLFLLLSVYSIRGGSFLVYTIMALCKEISSSDAISLYKEVNESSFYSLFGSFLVIFLTACTVFRGFKEGVEKWSNILMPALFFLLIVMLFFVSSFDSFNTAISNMLYPKHVLSDPRIILTSLGLALFSLCAGCGVFITSGSYMRSKESVFQISFFTAILLVSVAFLGYLIFGTIAIYLNHDIQSGFVFKSLVSLLKSSPATDLLATIFFSGFSIAVVSSTVVMLEVIVANSIEVSNISRKKATLIFSVCSFFLSVCIIFAGHFSIYESLTKILDVILSILFPVSALLIVFFIGWKVEKDIFKKSFSNEYLFEVWYFLIRYLVSFVIFTMFLILIWRTLV